jgi:hypothetical protein
MNLFGQEWWPFRACTMHSPRVLPRRFS